MSDIAKRIESLSPKQRELLKLQHQKKKERGPFPATDIHPVPGDPLAGGDSLQKEMSSENHPESNPAMRSMQFSLFFFSDDGSKDEPEKYRLLLESARFADTHGLSAVWTPERHFQDFGGLYPNPSVLGAALAMITERIQLRAGSVALPLHNPIRVAEEWSVVDNLSHGRVAISFASGWHPLDFVLSPASYQDRKELLFQNARVVQNLWAGESLAVKGVDGLEVKVKILPKPIQPRLPTWLTIQSKSESWVKAGEMGANVLTAIVSQPLDTLAGKIRLYRESLAEHGYDPAAGQVAVMLHTFLGEDNEIVKEQIRTPLMHYLRSNLKQLGPDNSILFEYENLTEADLDVVASYAFERYFDTILLCGTPAKCSRLVDRLLEAGVDEIACLIDFGLPIDAVMGGLHHLSILNKNYQRMDASKAVTIQSHV